MSPSENVAFAWKHRDLFAEVRQHTFEVIKRRTLGGDPGAPENQYRNAWSEAQAKAAA